MITASHSEWVPINPTIGLSLAIVGVAIGLFIILRNDSAIVTASSSAKWPETKPNPVVREPCIPRVYMIDTGFNTSVDASDLRVSAVSCYDNDGFRFKVLPYVPASYARNSNVTA